MSGYLCNICKKVFIKRPENMVVRCLTQHPPGSCCHYGEREIYLFAVCPVCHKSDVKTKSEGHGFLFVQCTNCDFDTEKIFDESFMNGVAKGFDTISGEVHQ